MFGNRKEVVNTRLRLELIGPSALARFQRCHEAVFVLARTRKLNAWQRGLDVLLPGVLDIADLRGALGVFYLVRTGTVIELIHLGSNDARQIADVTDEVNASHSKRTFTHDNHRYRLVQRQS